MRHIIYCTLAIRRYRFYGKTNHISGEGSDPRLPLAYPSCLVSVDIELRSYST